MDNADTRCSRHKAEPLPYPRNPRHPVPATPWAGDNVKRRGRPARFQRPSPPPLTDTEPLPRCLTCYWKGIYGRRAAPVCVAKMTPYSNGFLKSCKDKARLPEQPATEGCK